MQLKNITTNDTGCRYSWCAGKLVNSLLSYVTGIRCQRFSAMTRRKGHVMRNTGSPSEVATAVAVASDTAAAADDVDDDEDEHELTLSLVALVAVVPHRSSTSSSSTIGSCFEPLST